MHVECPDCKTSISWCCGRTDPEHPAHHCPYGRPVVHTHTTPRFVASAVALNEPPSRHRHLADVTVAR